MDEDTPISVGRVTGPQFFAERAADTGEGWLVGSSNVTYAGGKRVVHQHCTFATEAEAQEYADELRRKMA